MSNPDFDGLRGPTCHVARAGFGALPFRFVCIYSLPAPLVSAIGHQQQHVCGSLLLVQAQKS